jgi:hypothetical protein
LSAQLHLLIEVGARACKPISYTINKGELGGILGGLGTENIQGEVQKKLAGTRRTTIPRLCAVLRMANLPAEVTTHYGSGQGHRKPPLSGANLSRCLACWVRREDFSTHWQEPCYQWETVPGVVRCGLH